MKTGKPLILASALAVLSSVGLATAQNAGMPMSAAPRPANPSTASGKLADSFSGFAGSQENAEALVNGLRTGGSITLSSPPAISVPGTPPIAGTTTFTPPTRPMGYGSVRIALSLARAELVSQGITNPTPQQLQGTLVGSSALVNGTGTQSTGILQMRADGMGWGKIANTLGFRLGPLMSGKAPIGIPTTQVANASGGTITTGGRSARVVTGASGATTGSHGSKGIVTGSGASVGSHGGTMSGSMGHGAGGHSGIVSGAGHGNSAGGAGKR
ncbi:MAG: hypothetical protein WAZ34_14685 [Rhodocyclaceae bacterium]